MKLHVERITEKQFLHPRYWPTWLGLTILWLIAKLPWHVQMGLGKALGLLMFHTMRKRRFISCVNLELALTELPVEQRRQLNREHFISLGKGFVETAISWWGNGERLAAITQIEGAEHLHNALQQSGVILLTAHFTSMELAGRLLSTQHPDPHAVYRPHQNPVIEQQITKLRLKYCNKTIPRDHIREMIRSLQQGHVVWYAQDQHFHHKGSLFIPFFGVETPTNTATSRLAKLGGAQVIPFFTVRTDTGYLLRFLPKLEHFPGESVVEDTLRINAVIEQQIREFPAQYLWTHRRFKDPPEGGDRYQHYRDNPPTNGCL
jgi:KDO2-lipid IV(A) lauroyltransferase